MALLLALAPELAFAQRAITRTGERLDEITRPDAVAEDETEAEFSDVTIEPELQALIDQLGSSEYALREAAMRTMLERRFDRAQIYKALAEQAITPEQRHRLLTVVLTQLATTPRGAVGIQLDWVQDDWDLPGAVVVTGVIPGMPAEKVLQFGDRITHVNDSPLHAQEDFSRAVQGQPPGTVIQLTVQRPIRAEDGAVRVDDLGRVLYDTHQFPLTLGSVEDLEQNNGGRVLPSPIVSQIQGEIRWAQRRYAPNRRTVLVPRTLPTAASIDGIEPSVYDDHLAIQTLLAQQRRIREGMTQNPEDLRAQWSIILQDLIEATRDPGLSVDQRNYRIGVAIRFQELMNLDR